MAMTGLGPVVMFYPFSVDDRSRTFYFFRMLQATRRKVQPKRGIRFRGIVSDAIALGVERTHLYRVLTGERPSVSLMRRYRDLKSS
jgi:hypothetical protein